MIKESARSVMFEAISSCLVVFLQLTGNCVCCASSFSEFKHFQMVSKRSFRTPLSSHTSSPPPPSSPPSNTNGTGTGHNSAVKCAEYFSRDHFKQGEFWIDFDITYFLWSNLNGITVCFIKKISTLFLVYSPVASGDFSSMSGWFSLWFFRPPESKKREWLQILLKFLSTFLSIPNRGCNERKFKI